MAGDGHDMYKSDPAIERWQQMHNTMHQRFRFTATATRKVVTLGVVVPLLAYWLAAATDNKFDARSKQRGESLFKNASKAPESE
ncbi:unnamed protein product [Jaminaea pallidilutea]